MNRARPDLRLIVITDRAAASPRDLEDLVRACLEAGAPAVQLRDKAATARELHEQAERLRALTARHDALLFINDRADVALATGADGVHLGPGDLPVNAARRILPPGFLIGYSTDDPAEARDAEAAGAAYLGCGAVFRTASKEEAAGEQIGPRGLAEVVRAVSIPVVGIGGIRPENIGEIAAAGAAGAAVIHAVMAAADPAEAVRRLLEAFPDPTR